MCKVQSQFFVCTHRSRDGGMHIPLGLRCVSSVIRPGRSTVVEPDFFKQCFVTSAVIVTVSKANCSFLSETMQWKECVGAGK